MRFGRFVGLAVLGLACATAARAQFGLYGMYAANGLRGIQCYDPTGKCSSGGGNVNPSGLLGGAYYDFKSFGPIRLGADLRGGVSKSNKSAVNSSGGDGATTTDFGLVGVRASVKTPISFLKPYVQGSVGFARSDGTEPLTSANGAKYYDNFLEYEGFAGLDVHVLPILDLRAIELGVGEMNRVGSGSGTSSVGVRSIGVGLVVHLP